MVSRRVGRHRLQRTIGEIIAPAEAHLKVYLPWLTRPDLASGVLALGILTAYAWLLVGGGLHLDDIRAQAYASGRSFWPFVIESNRTHLSPGARTIDWLHVTFAPFDYRPAIWIVLGIVALLTATVWLMLRDLLGPSRLAVTALGFALLSPSMIPGFAWYRQAITGVLGMTLTLVTLALAIAFARRRVAVLAIAAVFAHILALAFSERAIVTPVVTLVAFLVLGGGLRLRQFVLVTALGLVNIAFLIAYASGDYDDGRGADPTVSGFILSTTRSVFVNIIPSLMGGPLRWQQVLGGYSFAHTPWWFAVIATTWVLFIVMVWFRRRPRPSLALPVGAVVLSYVLPVYGVLYYGRISHDRIDAVDDLRLFPEVTVALVFLGAAVIRDMRGAKTGMPLIDRHSWIVVLVAALAAALSWVQWGTTWHSTTSRDYFDKARASILASRGPIAPSSFPDAILPAFYQTDISTADMVRAVNPRVDTILTNGPASLVTWEGDVQRGSFYSVGSTRATNGFCGAYLPAGGEALTVEFPEPVSYQRSALLQLRGLVGDEVTLSVDLIDGAGTPHRVSRADGPVLLRGPQTLVYPVPWNVESTAVVVSARDEHPDVCINQASIIVPFVNEGTE